MSTKITSIRAREILSAGAYPTIETTMTLEDGSVGKASVPFGSSAGTHEAIVVSDGDESRYHGKGMLTAINNVNNIISNQVIGMDALDQKAIDSKLNELDNTPKKEMLGGNSVLSVSLATIRAAANSRKIPLYKQILDAYQLENDITEFPKPMMVLIEGGAHADNSTDFQEYLITIDLDAKTSDRIRAGIEIYHSLAKILKNEGYSTNVGLEGAFAPSGIDSNHKPLEYLRQAITDSGYTPGDDIGLALDVAASEFYENGSYHLKLENREMSVDELMQYYSKMIQEYPIVSVEDMFDEDDWDAWFRFNQELGENIMVVGDDLTVTQYDRLKKASELNAVDSLIIKPNQVGTLSELMDTVDLANTNKFKSIVSHRGGGETTDTFIADLAVAVQAAYIKTGPSRGERVVKYNRLMEIAEELGF